MYKTSIYTLVNGNVEELARRKQQKSQKVILPTSHCPFCRKFHSHCNGGQSGWNLIGSSRWPIPENSPIEAKILQISLTQAEL